MMSAIDQAILALGASLALSTLVKATLALLLGLAAFALAHRKRAAFRHAILAATFGVLLALPIAALLAPPVRIAMRLVQPRNLPAPTTPSRAIASAPAPSLRTPDSPPAPSTRWTVSTLLTAVWIAGAALFLLPIFAGLRQVSRLRRSALPWPHAPAVPGTPAIDVLLHESLPGPMTCGVLRPAIVLPADAPNWVAADLDRAFVHELEHVTRRDWPIHCIARALCAVYWFHPLVWVAWRQLELEAERACDDAVLNASEPTAYAEQLLALARRLTAAAKSPLLAMASRADLGSRVHAVLDPAQPRGRAGARCVAIAAVTALVLVAALSPLRIVAAPQSATAISARFRTTTSLVMMDVTVTYPNGAAVEGLTAADFTLTEDGVPQTISLFEARPAAPGDTVLAYYILGYYPRNGREDGAFRKVEIAVRNATTATVNHRLGYTVRQSAPPAQTAAPQAAAAPTITPPRLIFKKDAEYSEEARKAKYQGTVLLDLDIDSSGKVTGAHVIRSLGLGLDEKAIEAVRQWRFKPASQNGQPVAVSTQVEVVFRLL